MTQTPIDPRTGATYGELVAPRSPETSGIEKTVFDYLTAAGYPVLQERQGILVHHPDEKRDFLTLTPDILLPDWRLAIEIDPCSPATHSRAFTHLGHEDQDRLRNDLLAAVGWTVIRLRLGATKGAAIGKRDVVVESSTFTKAAQSALTEALDDFKAKRRARVRQVKKGASPKPTQRRSHVVNIGEYGYSDGGYIFGWYPDLDSAAKVTLRLPMGGRYLYTHDREARFITELGLHERPREEWKDALTQFLQGKNPEELGTTKWPWGDTLLTHDGADVRAIVDACEHEKHTIDRADFWFTVTGILAPRWSPTVLLDERDGPLVGFHPDAVRLGYQFVAVESRTGRWGPYQRFAISRETAMGQGSDM